MAQQWIAPEFGDIGVLQLVEVDVAPPRSGEVTIAVRAAGVNPSDAKSLGGGWNPDPSQLPLRPGQEVAGVVTAVGPATQIATGEVAVGDEVIAFKIAGGFSSSVTVAAADVFAKPAGLDWPAAANLLHVGVVAAELLHLCGAAAGETVLVHGASGSVGMSVLQQARVAGVRVIGTASATNQQKVRDAGAEPVVYGDGLADRVAELAPDGIHAAIDAAGTAEALAVSMVLVGDASRVATLAPGKAATEIGVHVSAGGKPDSIAFRGPARHDVLALAAAGHLTVPMARTFALAEARDALALVASGHPGGKIALIP
jgi:NADPH:quinone reductase-like Zn-dependent oxidoreductase